MRTSTTMSVSVASMAIAALLVSGCSAGSEPENSGEQAGEFDREEIIFGMDPSFAPYAFQAANGSLEGFNIDIAHAVGQQLDIPVTLETVAWDGIIPSLEAGQIDVIPSIAMTEERQKVVLFSDDIMTKFLTTVVSKDRTDLNPGAKELRALSVGVQAGSDSAYAAEELQLPNVIEYNSIEDLYQDLILGRIDAGIVGNLDSGYTVSNSYPDDLRVTGVNIGVGEVGVNAAFRLDDVELKRAFDSAIVALSENGTLDKLVGKWFGEVG